MLDTLEQFAQGSDPALLGVETRIVFHGINQVEEVSTRPEEMVVLFPGCRPLNVFCLFPDGQFFHYSLQVGETTMIQTVYLPLFETRFPLKSSRFSRK